MVWVTGVCLLWAYDFTLHGKSSLLSELLGIRNVNFNHVPLWDVIPLIKDAPTSKLTSQQRWGSCVFWRRAHAMKCRMLGKLVFVCFLGWGPTLGGAWVLKGVFGWLSVCEGDLCSMLQRRWCSSKRSLLFREPSRWAGVWFVVFFIGISLLLSTTHLTKMLVV